MDVVVALRDMRQELLEYGTAGALDEVRLCAVLAAAEAELVAARKVIDAAREVLLPAYSEKPRPPLERVRLAMALSEYESATKREP